MTGSAQPSQTERFTTDHPYALAIGDMAALNRVVFKRKRAQRIVLIAALGLIVLVSGKGVLDSLGREDYETAAAIAAALLFVFAASFWIYPQVFAWFGAALWWLGRKSSSVLQPTGMELSAEGLRTRSSMAGFEYRWSGITDIVRTRDHLFLFIARRMAFIVPRRAFATADRFAAFCDAAIRLHQDAAGA